MSNDGPTKEAKKALCALLQRLNINKVVCVDDEHASPLTLDDILSWLETSSPEELISAFPEFKGPVSQDPDILKESFRKWWKGLELKQKDEFSNQARPFVQEEAKAESPDVDYMSILSEVFQGIDDITFSPLNLQEWHRQSEGLLAAPDCSQILFLFDQDMSKGGGRSNEGSAIVGSVLKKNSDSIPLCGILTHTANSDTQNQKWEELADEAGIAQDDFLVIPKSLLTDDLNEFNRQIKSAILAPSFRELKEMSAGILSESLEKAKEGLNTVTVLDFDHMIMRVAHGEGVWEGQMLFRLYTHFHRMEADKRARENIELAELIKRIRKVSNIPEMGKAEASKVIKEIRHGELYEDEKNINSAHMDITTGDVFEGPKASDGKRRLMMIATQACDLAMRFDGTRKADYVLLLHLSHVSNSEANKPRFMVLPYFSKDGAKEKIAVDFISTSMAPCWVLETCVLDQEGKCGFRLNAEPPDGLLPGWTKRFIDIRKKAKSLFEQWDVSCIADDEVRKDILTRMAPRVTSCGSVQASFADNEIHLPLRRVMRLRSAMAVEVVRQYAAFISRTPQEADLARKA